MEEQAIMSTLASISEMASQIGEIAECNYPYQRQLASRIASNGKPLEELTLGELLAMDREESERYSQREREFEQWKAEQHAAGA